MNYRIKTGLYIFAAAILLLLTYSHLRKTTTLISDYYHLKTSLTESDYSLSSIDQLKAELNSYNQKLGYTNNSDTSNQSRLLNFISEYTTTHKSRISFLPKSKIQSNNGYEIETNIMQLEGDFKDILKLVYAIEREQKLAKVVSLNFEVKEDWVDKTRKLTATAYFQNIKVK